MSFVPQSRNSLFTESAKWSAVACCGRSLGCFSLLNTWWILLPFFKLLDPTFLEGNLLCLFHHQGHHFGLL